MLSERNRKAVEAINKLMPLHPVAFIGSGLTQPYYPGWTRLLELIGAELNIPLDTSLNALRQAEVFRKSNEAGYAAKLVEIFGAEPKVIRQGLKDLVRLPLSACVTTNYDYSVYSAICDLGIENPDRWCYPEMVVGDCRKRHSVFFLHGAVVEDRIANLDHFVLHESAYLKAYYGEPGQGPAPLAQFLYNLFTFYDVLFIGFGARKEEPMNQALEIAHRHGAANHSRLLLAPVSRSDDEKENLKLKYGFTIVEYDPEGENHPALDEIIAEVRNNQPFVRPTFPRPLAGMDAGVLGVP